MSETWHRSTHFPEVSYAVRKPSLKQRIELTAKVRELMAQHEFLKAGDVADQLSASLSELLVRKLYLEWGIAAIKGLSINGGSATVALLIEFGPELLAEEMANAVIGESGLNEDERKNS